MRGIDAIDAEREEADEGLGYDDDNEIVIDSEEDHDSEDDENDELSSGNDYFDVEEFSEFSNEDLSDDESEYCFESHRGHSRSKKRKRHDSLLFQNSSLGADDENLPSGKSLTITLKIPHRGRRSACNAIGMDDDEDLPSPNRATFKKEAFARKQPSTLRQTTLDDLRVTSALRTHRTPKSSLIDRGTMATQRDAMPNASTPPNAALPTASVFPLPTPPSENQQRMHQRQRAHIDLTAEPDEKPVIIKGEAIETFSINERGHTTVTTSAADEEDSEDLADEARLIEIRRKLRAKKKRKRAAGQTTF